MSYNATDESNTSTNYVPSIEPKTYDQAYDQGIQDGLDVFFEKLKMFGEALCIILEYLPSKEISIPYRISDECVLEFTVSKK